MLSGGGGAEMMLMTDGTIINKVNDGSKRLFIDTSNLIGHISEGGLNRWSSLGYR